MAAGMDAQIEQAWAAAIDVLMHNARGPCGGLPRTAGWGYPEPYTRDLMLCMPGFAVSGRPELLTCGRRVLEVLADHQTPHGHIPSLVHDPHDLGASDTTPLFLLGLAVYREAGGRRRFLAGPARKAMNWMLHQSPDDSLMVAQQPTSDWRDEQWVPGFGLYVNSLWHAVLRLYGRRAEADRLAALINGAGGRTHCGTRRVHEGLALPDRPVYALWAYKIYRDPRTDVLGNSLAILSGLASRSRAAAILDWIERACARMRRTGELAGRLPPCLFPFIRPGEPDWRPRYAAYNRPGEYHNGGVWPFVCGFYVAALVAAGRKAPARRKLDALAALVRPAMQAGLPFGFNEWFHASTGRPGGQDWQSWSAALYLYAVACVQRGRALFFPVDRS